MKPNIEAAIKEAQLLLSNSELYARYDKHHMPTNNAARIVRGAEYIIYTLGGEVPQSICSCYED